MCVDCWHREKKCSNTPWSAFWEDLSQTQAMIQLTNAKPLTSHLNGGWHLWEQREGYGVQDGWREKLGMQERERAEIRQRAQDPIP